MTISVTANDSSFILDLTPANGALVGKECTTIAL